MDEKQAKELSAYMRKKASEPISKKEATAFLKRIGVIKTTSRHQE